MRDKHGDSPKLVGYRDDLWRIRAGLREYVMGRQKGKGWMDVRRREFWECSRQVGEFSGWCVRWVGVDESSISGPWEHRGAWDKWTFELRLDLRADHLSDSPWGFIRGSSSMQTARVPKKFVFIAASA